MTFLYHGSMGSAWGYWQTLHTFKAFLTAAFEQLPVFHVEDFATLILTCQQKADMIF